MTDLETALLTKLITEYDHLTVLKFTTNYRVSGITPRDHADIQVMAAGATLEEALLNFVKETSIHSAKRNAYIEQCEADGLAY